MLELQNTRSVIPGRKEIGALTISFLLLLFFSSMAPVSHFDGQSSKLMSNDFKFGTQSITFF